MTNVLLLIVFAIAIALTLLSAWTRSRFAYYTIVCLFAAGFMLDLVHGYSSRGTWDPRAIAIDVCVFGFLLYFITVQNVMGRKVSAVATNNEYKNFLLKNNKYRGFLKFVYHLPFVVIVMGIGIAVFWEFLA